MKHIILFTALVFLGGCQTFAKMIGVEPAQPTIRVQDIKLDGFSKEGIQLQVYLRVANPNYFEATIKNLKYRLSVKDSLLAEGIQTEPVKILGQDSTLVKLPLRVFGDRVSLVFKSIIAKGVIPTAQYHIVGTVETFFGDLDLDRESTWEP